MSALSLMPRMIGDWLRRTGGEYGVWVETAPEQAREVEAAFRRAGAVEVRSE